MQRQTPTIARCHLDQPQADCIEASVAAQDAKVDTLTSPKREHLSLEETVSGANEEAIVNIRWVIHIYVPEQGAILKALLIKKLASHLGVR